MPIMGAVLVLSPSATEPDLDALRWDARITLGERLGARQAIVLDTRSLDEERSLVTALRDHPGVLDLQIASHDFSDLLGPDRGLV